MMRMRTKLTSLSPSPMNGQGGGGGRNGGGGGGGGNGGGDREERPENWEVRPCGMLVQKRLDEENQNSKPPPTIRVRVKYGSIYHEIHINSQASFGELKKKLSGLTGLHHEDQKLYYKDKERASKEFLDIVGVKDKSKLVLVEDPISQEKRYLEIRKNAKMEKAAKSISQISLDVDKLAAQVAALESEVLKGGRVAEKEVVDLIELLMNELIKLDAIVADGDVKLQRKMQVRRVQKYVETLDMIKVKNSKPTANGGHIPNQNQQKMHTKTTVIMGNGQIQTQNQERPLKPPPIPQQPQRHSIGHSPLKPQEEQQQRQRQPLRHSTSGTVVTTEWETFDSTPPTSSSSSSTPNQLNKPKFPWDFFE